MPVTGPSFSGRPTPDWLSQRRYGLFVHMAIATVPAFSPVHEYSEWYWSHLSDRRLDDVVLHPAPLPEVQAWHRQHHRGRSYDSFIDDLTMQRWDADEIAALAVDAGMGYLIHTSKHHDGYCFFDSALTDRTTMKQGPGRDPVGELARASRDAGLVHGLYYSLLDWSHPAYGDPAYVRDYLHPQVTELVERYGPDVLWGDGHWGRSPDYWRSDELLETYYRAVGPSAAVNDRWGASHADYVTFEYDTPADRPSGPFEVCRGVGYSFGWNRAERIDDHLTPSELVALLTETVAKGGNLLINIGPRADGSIPEAQSTVLRDAGRWITANSSAIDGTVPFDTWGDESLRYTVGPSDDGEIHLNAIDLTGAARVRLGALVPSRYEVLDGSHQDRRGVVLERPADAGGDLAVVYRLRVRAVERQHIDLDRAGPAASISGQPYRTITAALEKAVAGDLVLVADGRHHHPGESYPLHVPAGVTLRGHHGAVLDAGGADADAVVRLAGAGATVSGLTITGVSSPGFMLSAAGVLAREVDDVTVEHCVLIESSIVIEDSERPVVTETRLDGGGVTLRRCDDAVVSAVEQSSSRWGAGITVDGGSRNHITRNRVSDDLTGIAVRDADETVVSSNVVRTRWWGIHLDGARSTAVSRNDVDRTMRAICLTAADRSRIVANRLTRCDSGVLLEDGTAATTIVDNTIDDCRLGIFVWSAEEPTERSNRVLRLREVDA
jgi:alpha-L-fucosidase